MVTKAKERRKRKSEEKERRKRKKSNGRTLRFYNGYLLWRSLLIEKKNCWTQKVHLEITFSKIPARYSSLQKYTKSGWAPDKIHFSYLR